MSTRVGGTEVEISVNCVPGSTTIIVFTVGCACGSTVVAYSVDGVCGVIVVSPLVMMVPASTQPVMRRRSAKAKLRKMLQG